MDSQGGQELCSAIHSYATDNGNKVIKYIIVTPKEITEIVDDWYVITKKKM